MGEIAHAYLCIWLIRVSSLQVIRGEGRATASCVERARGGISQAKRILRIWAP